jgi:hypothetical protein
MKNSFLLLFIAFITNFGFAQAPPQGINYQAVVYSDNGENEPGLNVPGQVLRNKNIRVRFTIIQNATNGTEVYKESHTKTTDAFGMFSLVIGAGTPQGGSIFSNINWGVGLHFLKVEIDKRGGTNYVTMSNQQLLSVPYALYSDKSTYATSAGNGITSVSDNGNGSLTFTYTDGSTYTTPILTGLQGPQGIQGATGAQGPAGQNGTNGVNGTDGINGTNGANGQNGLSAYEIWLSQGNTGTESDFLNSVTAGAQGIPGQNGANGQNGLSAYQIWLSQGNTGTESDFLTSIIGAVGAQGSQGVAGSNGSNGADGKNTLAKTTTETAGANCTTGGVKLEYGLDANNNGTLEVSEINASLTKYVCNGAVGATGAQGIQGTTGSQGIQGVAGSNGSNGADGKNTLAKTTTETAGVNCTTGGVKIEYGLDANSNGTLDVSEINASLTKYVCNGAVGATGVQGIQGATGVSIFSNMQVFSTAGTTTFTVPTGVTKIMVEVWGGGGGGGGTNGGFGAGGGGGAYGKQIINVISSTAYSVVVGTGGTAGSAGGVGGSGGLSSFGTGPLISAGGGSGGQPTGAGGAGGTSTATFNISGEFGRYGYNTSDAFGGGAPNGGHGGLHGVSSSGGIGNAPGGGGGGAGTCGSCSNTGGAGAVGRVVVWY